jgi:hypothetical protein
MELKPGMRDLAAQVAERRQEPFILFLGAGCARAANVPSVRQMALKTFHDLFEKDPEDASQYISREDYLSIRQHQAAPDELLVDAFYWRLAGMSPMSRYTLLESFYADLPIPRFYQDIVRLARDGYFRHFLTTSIDQLLEEAFRSLGLFKGRDYTVINMGAYSADRQSLPEDPFLQDTITIVKLHGDVAGMAMAISPEEIQDMLQPQRRFVKAELTGDVIMVGYEFESDPINKWLGWTRGELWWVSPDPPDVDRIESIAKRAVRLIDGRGAQPDLFFSSLSTLIEYPPLPDELQPRSKGKRTVRGLRFDPDDLALGEELSEDDAFEVQMLRRQLGSSEATVQQLQKKADAGTARDRTQLQYEQREIAQLEDELRGLVAPKDQIIELMRQIHDAAEEAQEDPAIAAYLGAQVHVVESEYAKSQPNQKLIGTAIGAVGLLADRLDSSIVSPRLADELKALAPSAAKGGAWR